MTNRVNAVAVERRAAAVAPVHPRMVDHFLPHVDRDDDLLRLLVLIPAGSIVIAGLLAIALSGIAEAPTLAPGDSSYEEVDMASRAEFSIVERLGLAFTR